MRGALPLGDAPATAIDHRIDHKFSNTGCRSQSEDRKSKTQQLTEKVTVFPGENRDFWLKLCSKKPNKTNVKHF